MYGLVGLNNWNFSEINLVVLHLLIQMWYLSTTGLPEIKNVIVKHTSYQNQLAIPGKTTVPKELPYIRYFLVSVSVFLPTFNVALIIYSIFKNHRDVSHEPLKLIYKRF